MKVDDPLSVEAAVISCVSAYVEGNSDENIVQFMKRYSNTLLAFLARVLKEDINKQVLRVFTNVTAVENVGVGAVALYELVTQSGILPIIDEIIQKQDLAREDKASLAIVLENLALGSPKVQQMLYD